MKVFIVQFKSKWNYTGFLEANNSAEVLKFFSDNAPAKTRILSITEGSSDNLTNIKELLKC